jgi:CheY-like chemotaxis protein
MAQVLVANADADLRELLVELLAEAGHQVLGVADSKVAWHLLRMASSRRVAVLDIDMLRLDGLHALQKALTDPQVARRHGLIVLTALPLGRLRRFAPELFSDLPESVVVLNKPFDLEDLEQAVEKVAQKSMVGVIR